MREDHPGWSDDDVARAHENLRDLITGRMADSDTRARYVKFTSSERFTGLNAFAEMVARAAHGREVTWSPSNTWAALTKIVDDATELEKQRNLFAAKVLMGRAEAPAENEIVPGSYSPTTVGELKAKPGNGVASNRSFNESITLRKAYLAPSFNAAAVNALDYDSTAVDAIATTVLEALIEVIRRTPATPAAASGPRGRTWRKWSVRRRRALFISGGAVALIALVAAIVIPLTIGDSRVLAATTAGTYMPSHVAVINALDLPANPIDATCAPSSISTPRSDARTCLLTAENTIVHDPCFVVSANAVVCPTAAEVSVGADDLSLVARLVETVDVDWARTELVGADQARDAGQPWAFMLDRRTDSGEPYLCVTSPGTSYGYTDLTYNCTAGGAFSTYIGIGIEAFQSGGWIALTSDGVLTASDLDRSGDVWTVAIRDPDTTELQEFAVERAWF